jgi:S1-C subfamily serine protease
LFDYIPQPALTPERILDTIVSVNGSSGVIVHSDTKNFLVLTAYHNIERLVDFEGNLIDKDKPVLIGFKYVVELDDRVAATTLHYEASELYVDIENDLALLAVNNGIYFNYAKILDREVDIAEEVYIASNPNSHNYRSITKGIISSKNRSILDKVLIQASGGLIYGSSGGGLFTENGRLIGIARAVDLYNTGFCESKIIHQGEIQIQYTRCFKNPISYIGYFIPTEKIKQFLQSTKFKNNFEYLK